VLEDLHQLILRLVDAIGNYLAALNVALKNGVIVRWLLELMTYKNAPLATR